MAQTILVTGSSSGFGHLMVETLARQGYTVFAGMRAVAGKNAPAAEELRALAQRERLALPFSGPYVATKFALEALTESYRYELAPFGIDAAIIEPGTYPTQLAAKPESAADTQRAALYQAPMDAFMRSFFAENRSATPPNPTEVED